MMISDVRNNLDILLVVGGALLIYHLYRKAQGRPRGMAK